MSSQTPIPGVTPRQRIVAGIGKIYVCNLFGGFTMLLGARNYRAHISQIGDRRRNDASDRCQNSRARDVWVPDEGHAEVVIPVNGPFLVVIVEFTLNPRHFENGATGHG